ncbi:nitroreductase family protein [Nocardia sp. NPDC050712]|uniref:Acg family FMN-binding oxidoreductase n=1 Tax=Nocardia sp. NPDC050712 TaxID=3155518 RepID=UPI00340C88FA
MSAMNCAYPSVDTIRAAIGLAQRAPSVHNSQPWRWHLINERLHLYADTSRHLPATDPHQRALIVSCGAVLHHARVALGALGWHSEVETLPNPAVPEYLAVLDLAPRRPTATDIQLAAAMTHRRSDRRRFDWGKMPELSLKTAVEYGTRFGAGVQTVASADRPELSELIRRAARHHAHDVPYRTELAAWSGCRGTREGVPARNTAAVRAEDELPGRAFADPALADPKLTRDAATWLVIATDSDERAAQLRAGESLSALLLAATDLGLATCVQTEPLGLPELREEIRFSICAGKHPQVMVRAGLATRAAPLAETPRRRAEDVLPF